MDYATEANRCLRCGMCQAACPLYQVQRREQYVARGKAQIVKKLVHENSLIRDRTKTIFYECLDCRACMEVCPANVNTSVMVRSMRERIFNEHGDNLLMNVFLEHLTPYPSRLEMVRKSLRLYQNLGLAAVARLLPALQQKEKILPPVPKQSFRTRIRNRQPPKGRLGKVAYFISCTSDILYPDVGTAIIEVLEACGFEVYLLVAGTCCGVPQIAYGHVSKAKEMALQNMRAVPGDIDFIINDCATCGSALQEYAELFAGTEYEEMAKHYSKRVLDISAFLGKYAEVPACSELGLRVTYHEPCHLGRAQGVREEPRKLVAMSGSQLTEMHDPGRCCGGAGTFGITHFEIAQKILQRKIIDIAQTESDAVVTGCPGCRMQISFGLKTYHKVLPIYHPVELLAQSLRNPGMRKI